MSLKWHCYELIKVTKNCWERRSYTWTNDVICCVNRYTWRRCRRLCSVYLLVKTRHIISKHCFSSVSSVTICRTRSTVIDWLQRTNVCRCFCRRCNVCGLHALCGYFALCFCIGRCLLLQTISCVLAVQRLYRIYVAFSQLCHSYLVFCFFVFVQNYKNLWSCSKVHVNVILM